MDNRQRSPKPQVASAIPVALAPFMPEFMETANPVAPAKAGALTPFDTTRSNPAGVCSPYGE
jgi:hypothetical protein